MAKKMAKVGSRTGVKDEKEMSRYSAEVRENMLMRYTVRKARVWNRTYWLLTWRIGIRFKVDTGGHPFTGINSSWDLHLYSYSRTRAR